MKKWKWGKPKVDICSRCKTNKKILGQNYCKECDDILQKVTYLRHLEENRKKSLAHYYENHEEELEKSRLRYKTHPFPKYPPKMEGTKICNGCREEKSILDFYPDTMWKDGRSCYCTICSRAIENEYENRPGVKEKAIVVQKKWEQENKEHIVAVDKKREHFRYRNDINFKLKAILSSSLNLALKENRKSGSAVKLLGCTISEFKLYIEKQWLPGMTWANHTLKGWHLDHKKCLASFDLSKPEEQQKCFYYTNYQPMWAIPNIQKSSWHEGKKHGKAREKKGNKCIM